MIQDNITFNNVAFQTYAAVNDILSRDSAAKINAGKGRPIVNAVSIDWNGAEVDENTVINTTGQLLAWIKEGLAAAAQSGGAGQGLTEEQLETFNTATNLLGFISDYALRTSDADTRYTLKSLFDTTITEIRETMMTSDAVNEIIDAKGYQTEDQVNEKIQAVVGAAPEALDTLQEIAAKLGDNDDAVAALTSTIANKANAADVYTKTDADANFATKQSVDELISEVDEANETTAEALIQLQENINNIQLTPGEQGPKGDKGDKGDTGTFDASALENYATNETVQLLINRISLLEAKVASLHPEQVEQPVFKAFTSLPTAEEIAASMDGGEKPEGVQQLDMTSLTGPTNMYLVYPLSWEIITSDTITSPVITTSSGFKTAFYPDENTPTITADGIEYRIADINLGKDKYTIQFL